MTQQQGTRYGAIALEMFSIVVAIVLGFAVTRWNEVRIERERAETAVERMQRELTANRASLAELAPYHRETAAAVDSLLATVGDTALTAAIGLIPGWNGLRPPRVRSASFTVATTTGALAHVDFALADALAAAYESLDKLEIAADQIMGGVLSGQARRLSDLSIGLTVLWEHSVVAIGQIDEALRLMGSGEPGAGEELESEDSIAAEVPGPT